MTVLILGWKPEFGGLIGELGLKCVVVLGDLERAGHARLSVPNCHLVHVKDVADVARVLTALARAGYHGPDFTAVHADREQLVVPAAAIARLWQCRGMPLDGALAGHDKWVQKQAVQAVGVRTPRIELLPFDPAERAATLRCFRYPALLKPVASSRSRYISTVSCVEEAIALTAVGPPEDSEDTEAFTVEEFVNAPEIHVDGVVRDNSVIFVSVGAYRVNILAAREHAEVSSILLDPREHEPQYAEARRLCEAVFRGMRLPTAAFHLEAFSTPDGLVFSECAVRTGGTFIPEVVEAKFGVDLRRAAFELALGQPVSRLPVTRPACVGWTYLPAPPGRLLSWPDADSVLTRPGVRRVKVEPSGSRACAGQSDQARRAGLAVVEGTDFAQVDRRISDLVSWFRSNVRTEGTRDE